LPLPLYFEGTTIVGVALVVVFVFPVGPLVVLLIFKLLGAAAAAVGVAPGGALVAAHSGGGGGGRVERSGERERDEEKL